LSKCFFMKVDYSTGAIVFAYETPNLGSSALYRKVIQMNAGYSDDYLVLGVLNYPSTNIISRISNNGSTVLWSKQLNISGTSSELLYTLTQIDNDDIIVGGGIYNGSNYDHTAIKLDPASGAGLGGQTWNLANGAANNGGFDNAVVIPGTDTVIFTF